MSSKEVLFEKKRDLGDVIAVSFLFLKQEFKPLAKLVLIYVAPFLVLFTIGQVFIQQKLVSIVIPADPETMLTSMIPVYKNIFIFLVFNVFVQSLYIGAVYSYIDVYIKKGKGNFKISDVSPLLFQNSLLAFVTNVVFTVIVFTGLVMCFFFGIYFANTFALTTICVIFEKKGIGYAFSRSWKLVNFQWWNTLLLNIVALVILWIVSFILSFPAIISGISTSFINIGDMEPPVLPDWFWIASGVSAFLTSLLYIIMFTFWAFQYLNLVERIKPTVLPPFRFLNNQNL